MQSISPEMYPQLIDVINETYNDCVESIVSARLDGNNDIVCCVRGKGKYLTITIQDKNDSIQIKDLDLN